MHDTLLDRLGDGLTDFPAELRRLWRGPESAIGERAAEIRGRIDRLGDRLLERLFDEFVTACIKARALQRPSALRKVIRNHQRQTRKAPISAKFRSKTGQKLQKPVKNFGPPKAAIESNFRSEHPDSTRLSGHGRAGGAIH